MIIKTFNLNIDGKNVGTIHSDVIPESGDDIYFEVGEEKTNVIIKDVKRVIRHDGIRANLEFHAFAVRG